MSVSSTNHERLHAASGGNGKGKGSPAAADDAPTADDRQHNPDAHGVGSANTNRHVNRIPEKTDEELLAAYRAGDHHSFASLVERYQRELFHFLVRFLGDRAAAEDIFQETFLQVHQSADQFDPQRRFRPWLFTIAANKARDLMRSQARRPTTPLQATINANDDDSGQFIDLMQSGDPMPGEAMEREELQKVVQTTVEAMPEHLREILLLSYFHQFPYKEISDILQIPLGTVKSRLHAAVAYFAERWKNRIQRTNEG
jgi:RNA polymerase sigma-70 factor (ECF subfamily)